MNLIDTLGGPALSIGMGGGAGHRSMVWALFGIFRILNSVSAWKTRRNSGDEHKQVKISCWQDAVIKTRYLSYS